MTLGVQADRYTPEDRHGASADSRSFDKAVVQSNPNTGNPDGGNGLTVSGNAIDTGRYIITGSNSYTRADGSTANDGELKIYDKQTGAFVEMFGDPHVRTSAGDEAAFQQDGLAIELADGTMVQIKPTALSNGVAHIDAVSITKAGQTSFMTGFYSADGKATVQTSALKQGNAFQNDPTFDSYDDAVLRAGDDSVADLSFSDGTKLDSKSSELDLDGRQDGVGAFLDERNPMDRNYSAVLSVAGMSSGQSDQPLGPQEKAIPSSGSIDAFTAAFNTENDAWSAAMLQGIGNG
jgi:hypothetical protein